MTKDDKIHAKRVEHFNRCYGATQVLRELLEKMASDDGKPKVFYIEQVLETQKLGNEIACASLAMTATYDGQPQSTD